MVEGPSNPEVEGLPRRGDLDPHLLTSRTAALMEARARRVPSAYSSDCKGGVWTLEMRTATSANSRALRAAQARPQEESASARFSHRSCRRPAETWPGRSGSASVHPPERLIVSSDCGFGLRAATARSVLQGHGDRAGMQPRPPRAGNADDRSARGPIRGCRPTIVQGIRAGTPSVVSRTHTRGSRWGPLGLRRPLLRGRGRGQEASGPPARSRCASCSRRTGVAGANALDDVGLQPRIGRGTSVVCNPSSRRTRLHPCAIAVAL